MQARVCGRTQMTNGSPGLEGHTNRAAAGRDYTREQIFRTADAQREKCKVSAFSAS